MNKLKKKLFLGVIGLMSLILACFFSLWYFGEVPLVSPLSSLTTFKFISQLPAKGEKKIVYGFLPYWNLAEVQIQPELTQLAYFGLTVGADGKIMTRENKATEPGYNHLQSDQFLEISTQVEKNNGSVELVLTQFNNETIVSLLNHESSVQNLLTSLDSILLAYPVTGINLDIEYSGEVTDQLRQKFAQLVIAIRQHLKQKYEQIAFSVDVYAAAASKKQIWDVKAIEPHVDHLVVMAYDFHRRSSPQAGPVAPLFGGREFWDSDINQHLANFVKIVPKEKILLGIPFYGYEWQTTTRDPQAQTFPDTGSTASIKRIKEIIARSDELQVQKGWNEEALSPYLSYEENGKIFMVYYENTRSLAYKLDYVNQLNLGGIAIWALGYEDASRELWEIISKKL